MTPYKSVLLDEINTAIERKSCKKISEWKVHFPSEDIRVSDETKITYKNYYTYSENAESIKKLEEQIISLESQNDQLLYFIHYLYSNFSDLVKDILSSKNVHRTIDSILHDDEKEQRPSITRREKEILDLLGRGQCAKQIAAILFISETTVITHKKNLKKKFKVSNTVELIAKVQSYLFTDNQQ